MRKIRTFKCTECGNAEDRFVSDDVEIVDCNECGDRAEIQLSSPKYFGNSVGRSPSAVS